LVLQKCSIFACELVRQSVILSRLSPVMAKEDMKGKSVLLVFLAIVEYAARREGVK
jgi:hypothetical protein